MTVQEFLNSMGGTAQVARALGLPLTTVAAWGQRNKVPAWRMPKLAEVAVGQSKAVPANFDEPVAEPDQERAA